MIEVEATGALAVQDELEILAVQAFAPGEIPLGELSHDHDRQLQDYFAGSTTLA